MPSLIATVRIRTYNELVFYNAFWNLIDKRMWHLMSSTSQPNVGRNVFLANPF